jgi:tetratricopeptide (TPR) repeat protein
MPNVPCSIACQNVNSVRVQSTPVSQKRDRWLFPTGFILVFIAIGGFLLGRSGIIPPFNSTATQNQSAPNSGADNSMADSSASRQQELQTQAKGYELVLQRQPQDPTALKELVNTRLELARMGAGSIRDTIEPLEKLSQLNPDDTNYSILLAQTKLHGGDPEGAATVYRSMLESKPGNIEALEGLVTLLMQQKRPEAAIGLLQDTLDTAPKLNKLQPESVDIASVKLLLASIYAEQQRYNEAIALYDQGIKADKEDFRPVWGKAYVLQLQGKTDQAKTLFTSATNLAPAKFKDQIKARIKQLEAQAPASPSPEPEESPTP